MGKIDQKINNSLYVCPLMTESGNIYKKDKIIKLYFFFFGPLIVHLQNSFHYYRYELKKKKPYFQNKTVNLGQSL